KSELLARLLRRLEPAEIAIGVAYLSGHLRQGRIGIGGGAIQSAIAAASVSPRALLTLSDVDQAFESMATIAGKGSTAERVRVLADLLGRATSEERDFLVRLVFGELRQGALIGVMEEALARATGVSLAELRRAGMLSGDLEAVAAAVLSEGRPGLD